jgi:hypothetical protein
LLSDEAMDTGSAMACSTSSMCCSTSSSRDNSRSTSARHRAGRGPPQLVCKAASASRRSHRSGW